MTENAAAVWDGDLPANVRVIGDHVPGDYTPERGTLAWTDTVIALGDLNEAVRGLARSAPDGVQYQRETLGHEHVVTLIAAIQDARRDLAQTEAFLAREIGKDEATPRAGVLPDGRQYEVRRGTARKAWEHDAWKHDARAAVAREFVGEGGDTVILPETGETLRLTEVLAAVQEVHGSSAPRATALRRLGLDPDAYCETVPGSWSVSVVGESSAEG